jgi:ABC-type bacteriocin/lantibiotic exporter with double-glycine peptidase domain
MSRVVSRRSIRLKRVWTKAALAAIVVVSTVIGTVAWVSAEDDALYVPPPSGQAYCGLVSVANLCGLYHITTNMSEVYKYAGMTKEGTPVSACMRALNALGVPVDLVRFRSLSELPERRPFICVMRTRYGHHAVVALRRCTNVLLVDEQEIRTERISDLDRATAHVALVPAVDPPEGVEQ